MLKSVAAAVSLLTLAGCAINPLPEDVTGVDTYDIVRQIRCESRVSIIRRLTRWLQDIADNGDPIAAKILADFRYDPESISDFDYKMFSVEQPRIRTVARLFSTTGIAYSFDLTMSEDNDLTSDISLLGPFSPAKLTVGLNAGLKRKRSNQRVFAVTDTFTSLLRLNKPVRGIRYCDQKIVQANYVYPISGRIGVDHLVRDFMNVTVFASLADRDAKPNSKVTAPTMADKLTFTTIVNLNATPKIEFTPVATGLQVTSASLNPGLVRTDTHQVTVALAVDTGEIVDLQALRTYLFSNRADVTVSGRAAPFGSGAPGTPIVVGNRVTGEARTRSEALALIAIDQLKSRELQLVLSP